MKHIVKQVKVWNRDSFGRSLGVALLLGLFMLAVPGMRPDLSSSQFQALGLARDYLFDFAQWEVSALEDKALNAAVGSQHYMTEEERTRYVRDYIQLVYDIHQLEIQVQNIYADPNITDPRAASADLRRERDALRLEQRSRQALAESIIEAQIADVLVDYGFGVQGQVFPPVVIRFTEMPSMLILSPRDHIERIGAYPLEHGLTVDQQEALEDEVDAELGVSSLVAPIGGLGIWPAMLIETGYLPHVYEVGAHEWTHHYLSFSPLGFNYGTTPELYTMNETVASIVGREIGWATINRYYPDLAPPPPDYTPQQPQPETPVQPSEPPAFDFRAEMHETRVRVDEMLAAGQIEEAERYMEERRRMFVENGYNIRKLNQAYFAFYGSYADEPGATGADPIGPALREMRYYSASLSDFVATVRRMTTFAELQAALESLRRAHDTGG